jgi:hypothetical protein
MGDCVVCSGGGGVVSGGVSLLAVGSGRGGSGGVAASGWSVGSDDVSGNSRGTGSFWQTHLGCSVWGSVAGAN